MTHRGVWRTDINYGTDIWPTREAAEEFLAEIGVRDG